MICTFPSLKINIDNYPAIKNYLLSFGKERLEQTGKEHIINGVKIKARKKTNNKWFETQDSIAYWDDFSKHKIMYSEIVQYPKFYLDKDDYYPEATTFILTGDHLEYLVKLLNSDIVAFLFKKYYAGGGLGNGFRYKKVFLLNLPLPVYNDAYNQKLICSTFDEKQINFAIQNLYNLNDEEINYIFSSFKIAK